MHPHLFVLVLQRHAAGSLNRQDGVHLVHHGRVAPLLLRRIDNDLLVEVVLGKEGWEPLRKPRRRFRGRAQFGVRDCRLVIVGFEPVELQKCGAAAVQIVVCIRLNIRRNRLLL